MEDAYREWKGGTYYSTCSPCHFNLHYYLPLDCPCHEPSSWTSLMCLPVPYSLLANGFTFVLLCLMDENQSCPIELPAMIETLYICSIQYGSH